MILKRGYLQFKGASEPLINLENQVLEWRGIAALMDGSGQGKTSFFKLLSFYFEDAPHQSSCEWAVDNMPVRGIKFVGLQEELLPWLTMDRNISFFLGRKPQVNIAEIYDALGLEQSVNSLYPYQLSVGIYKRVELAIAVLQEPSLLLLDELFSSIDQESKESAKQFLLDQRGAGMTWVVSHEKSVRNWISSSQWCFDLNKHLTITSVVKK